MAAVGFEGLAGIGEPSVDEKKDLEPEKNDSAESDPTQSGDLRFIGPRGFGMFVPSAMVKSISPAVAKYIIPAIGAYLVPALAVTCILCGLGYAVSLVVEAISK
jgi:hypothetical protein